MQTIYDQARVCTLGIKNQWLLSKCLDYGWLAGARQLQGVDDILSALYQKAKTFDFAGEVAKGSILLVGEGNLSFAYSLTKKKRINPRQLIPTTFERLPELSEEALKNKRRLADLGIFVWHHVDATQLHQHFYAMLVDTIIFQFPHTGTREPIDGRNPNFILVRDFLKSAKRCLRGGGQIFISAVDTPYYHGAFQFDEAASSAGFQKPKKYRFDPLGFPGYVHSMTHEDQSAIAPYHAFATWVFQVL